MSKRRVVITGLGLLSPVGNNVTESWNNIIQGKSGVKPITSFDISEFETKFAATVDIAVEDFLDKKRSQKNRSLHTVRSYCFQRMYRRFIDRSW